MHKPMGSLAAITIGGDRLVVVDPDRLCLVAQREGVTLTGELQCRMKVFARLYRTPASSGILTTKPVLVFQMPLHSEPAAP